MSLLKFAFIMFIRFIRITNITETKSMPYNTELHNTELPSFGYNSRTIRKLFLI